MFRVILEGEGLYGDSGITVPANSTKKYEFLFSPLSLIKDTGTLAFIND
jgi:hypothetical protein